MFKVLADYSNKLAEVRVTLGATRNQPLLVAFLEQAKRKHDVTLENLLTLPSQHMQQYSQLLKV